MGHIIDIANTFIYFIDFACQHRIRTMNMYRHVVLQQFVSPFVHPAPSTRPHHFLKKNYQRQTWKAAKKENMFVVVTRILKTVLILVTNLHVTGHLPHKYIFHRAPPNTDKQRPKINKKKHTERERRQDEKKTQQQHTSQPQPIATRYIASVDNSQNQHVR